MIALVHKSLCTAGCLLFFLNFGYSQNIRIPAGASLSFTEVIRLIEGQSPYICSYSSDNINTEVRFQYSESDYSLDNLLQRMGARYKLSTLVDTVALRIVFTTDLKWTISGQVRDGISEESLQGVNVFTANTNTTTNEDGFFSITDNFRREQINLSYLGYNRDTLQIRDFTKVAVDISIFPDNTIEGIVIVDSFLVDNLNVPGKQIGKSQIEESSSIGGGDDLFSYLRGLPGVSVGSEGQNGLLVRGGGPEQNLILLDGLPIYEASHLGGLSSIFITDAIKNVDFYKSGFPARFGGKLSSVMDVRLKEGHRHIFRRSVTMGLEGVEGHLEGPISDNTSINLNGKVSWFSLLSAPLIKQNLDFDNSDLNYSDAFAKITHWFSPSNRLSLSIYKGNDLVRLSRDQIDVPQSFSITDFNRIEWGNTLVSLNWSRSMSNKLFSHTSLGVSSFNYSSRGSYNFNYNVADTVRNNGFDIFSSSGVTDYQLTHVFDMYSENAGTFKFGVNLIRHRNSPSIQESDMFLDTTLQQALALDSMYTSMEYIAFLENRYHFNANWQMHGGLRLSTYSGLDNSYVYLHPRMIMSYRDASDHFSISFARMSQFIHLLVNPGPGLPSDLWVPSTAKVAPEISEEISLAWNHLFSDKFSLSVSPYYKRFHNVIEYSNESDILYSLIIDNQFFNVAVDNSNWEERISTGKGRSYGAEFQVIYHTGNFNFESTYTWSRSERRFDDLNRGVWFPYKYDRRHNISSRVVWKFRPGHKLELNWVYGNGNAFTLSDQEIKGFDCQPRLEPSSRNNARVPDFHHLDIAYTYRKVLEGNRSLVYKFGVYNLYNRLNPFYVYLFQNPATQDFEDFRKISIYPILPQINIKYTW